MFKFDLFELLIELATPDLKLLYGRFPFVSRGCKFGLLVSYFCGYFVFLMDISFFRSVFCFLVVKRPFS